VKHDIVYFSNGPVSAPQFRKPALPFPGPLALGGDGRVGDFAPDDPQPAKPKPPLKPGLKSFVRLDLFVLAVGDFAWSDHPKVHFAWPLSTRWRKKIDIISAKL
jgi:hypothetical protein